MTTETHDDVAVPHFENRLWRELAEAHDQFRRHGPPPEHRRWPARRSRRLLLLGVGSIAAVAALIVGVVVASSDGGGVRTDDDSRPRDSGPADTSQTTGGGPEDQSLAGRIAAASEQVGTDYVLHLVQDMVNGPGDTETWADGRSGAHRMVQRGESGAPVFDSGPVTPPRLDAPVPPDIRQDVALDDPSVPWRTERQVDHCFQEYADGETWDSPATDSGDAIAEELRVGILVEDGTEVVDGRELIRLVRTRGSFGAGESSDAGASATTAVEGDLGGPGSATKGADTDEVVAIELIDPETYRPVRRIGHPGSSAEYVMTYEYLPRTPENLAQFAVPVPEGFTQVADVRSEDERADAGCS